MRVFGMRIGCMMVVVIVVIMVIMVMVVVVVMLVLCLQSTHASTEGIAERTISHIRSRCIRPLAFDMVVVALTGRGGGNIGRALRDTDVHICVPHERTARVQEVHILTLHCICDGVDTQLLGDQEGN